MPNLYVTPTELKTALPDGIRATTTKYDSALLRLAEAVSRYIDRHCRRVFYPYYGARYFRGTGSAPEELWVGDLLEIVSVEISTDGGLTYETLAATDYIATVGGDINDARSWTELEIDQNGSRSTWPDGQKGVRVTGWWGFADNRGEAWDDSGVDLADAYLAGDGHLHVSDVTVADRWGKDTALHAGRLLRVDNEMFEATVATASTGDDAVTVIAARNGTVDAGHAKGAGISIWRAPEAVQQAAIIQAVRQLERALQGFGDARATPDLGQMVFVRSLDAEAAELLRTGYRKEAVG